MSDDPMDLTPLEEREAVRERVVARVMERIAELPSDVATPGAADAAPDTGPTWQRGATSTWALALGGAAPFAAPALAAAAVIVLLLVRGGAPGGEAVDGPRAAVDMLVEPPGPWDVWVAHSAPPPAEQLLVTFAEGRP